MELKLKVTPYAKDITDEGILTFLAFCYKICKEHGFEYTYQMSIEDAGIISNKSIIGFEDWLRRYVGEFMDIGKPYDHILTFKLPRYVDGTKNRLRKIEKTITEPRQQMIWGYVLGCFNHQIVPEGFKNITDVPNRKQHIDTFNISREALGYVKVKDR